MFFGIPLTFSIKDADVYIPNDIQILLPRLVKLVSSSAQWTKDQNFVQKFNNLN